jgi:hypothetical protein
MKATPLRWKAALIAGVLLAPLALASQASAGGAVGEEREDVIGQLLTQLSTELRVTAAEPEARQVLFDGLIRSEEVDPLTVFAESKRGGEQFTRLAAAVDARVKEHEGLPKMQASSLTVRLYDPAGGLAKGLAPLYAAKPSGDDDELTSFPAEDANGRPVTIDAKTPPRSPVILVDLNMANILPEGMVLFVETLHQFGIEGGVLDPGPSPNHTILKRIKVKHDQEPWYKGGAEMFAMAMGGQNGQARVDVMDMGYLNHDGTTYLPDQAIIHWGNFTWTSVDWLIMEGDATVCDAGWAQYAAVVANAIHSAGQSASYTPLSNLAREALKDKDEICASWYPNWLIDLPDFVDSLNGLTQSHTGVQPGSTGNADTTLAVV